MAQPLHPQKLVKEAQSTPPHAAQQAPKNWFGYLLFALSFSLLLYVHTYDFFHPDEHLQAPANTFVPQLKNLPVPQTDIMSSAEQTFIAIKPDGVQRGLVGPIISRFESRGFKLAAIKLVSPSKEHLEQHYADLKDKAFFPGLISYMLSGPICAMVWEGRDAVKTGRSILGATNPLASSPGTIRGDYAIDVGRNVCHGSDSVENAKKEIALWFKEGDLVQWKSAAFDWIYEKA
ncbi:Nucleoside diphosphate kinase like protein [Verticillium longisporum]|nr:Nucleoside diphosphate kinase like protein [Verticillium longisporum]